MNKNKQASKKKNNLLMIGLLVGVIGVFGGIIYAIKTNTPNNNNSNVQNNNDGNSKQIDFSIVDDEDKLVKTRFLNKAEEELRQTNLKSQQTAASVKRLERQLKDLSDQMKKQQMIRTNSAPNTENNENLPRPPKKDFSDIFSKFPSGLPSTNSNTPKIKNPFKQKEEIFYEYEEIESSMTVTDIAEGATEESGNMVKPNGKSHPLNTSTIPEDAFFIPAGSVMVAYLEQGYDAPTLKNGKGDLVPSTLTIVGYTLLPNNKMYDLRGCKVLAEAEGKRSNERSYSRTKRLTCMDKENRPMDIPLKGYISDEGGDGKLGLKGNIVSMQNKFLQNAVWIGIVEGLASIGKATAMTQSATAQGGVVSTINPGQEFQAGLAGSVTETTSSIKEFLMDNVKSIEPVVEIKGGRLVAITLSEGFYVYPRIEYSGRKDLK